jgi:hypothetical protein
MTKITTLSGKPVICQLLSFIPTHIIEGCVDEHQSDYYYKVMTTTGSLIFYYMGWSPDVIHFVIYAKIYFSLKVNSAIWA